jgi:hypothetical protein
LDRGHGARVNTRLTDFEPRYGIGGYLGGGSQFPDTKPGARSSHSALVWRHDDIFLRYNKNPLDPIDRVSIL